MMCVQKFNHNFFSTARFKYPHIKIMGRLHKTYRESCYSNKYNRQKGKRNYEKKQYSENRTYIHTFITIRKKIIQENALTTGMNASDYIRKSALQKLPQSSISTVNVLEVITHAQNICNLANSNPYDNKKSLENEVKKLWQILP